jgi:hypothetical protein
MSGVLNDCDALLQGAAVRIVNPKNASIILTTDAPAFHVNSSGVADIDTITVTATLYDLDGPLTFSAQGATLSNVTDRSATVTYASMTGPTAIITATMQSGGVTFSQSCIIATTQDGNSGSSAKVLTLSATEQVFKVNKVGANSPASITLTASGQNIVGTPSFTIPIGTATLTAGANASQKILTFANMTSESVTVQIALDGQTDRITISKLRDGADGVSPVTGFLTNESVSISTNNAGTVASFAAAGGTFKVFEGATEVTGNAAVVYSVPSETGVDVSIATTGVYTIASMSADTGTATIRAVYKGVTVDRVYSISKARAGADGSSPVYVDVSTSGGQVFSRATAAATFAPASIVLGTTTYGGVATAYQWQYWSGTAWTAISGATAATYTVASGSLTGSRVFRAMATIGGATYFDEMTLVQVTGGTDGIDGADAIIGMLTNESVTLPAGSNGVVSSYSGAVCTMKVYKGTADDSANWTFAYAPASSSSSLAYTGSGGTVSVVTMAAGVDSAYVDVTASRTGYASITKRFNVTKSKAGTSVTGDRGAGTYYAAGSAWSDGAADAATPGGNVTSDVVTISNGTTFAMTKKWDGSAWVAMGAIYDGNLFVTGSINGAAIKAGTLDIRAPDGTVILSAGSTLSQQAASNPNLVPRISNWPVGNRYNGANVGFNYSGHPALNGELIVIPAQNGSVYIGYESAALGIPPNTYCTVSFDAHCYNGARDIYVDLYGPNADTPGIGPSLTGTPKHYTFTDILTNSESREARLRVFGTGGSGTAEIYNIKVELGTKATPGGENIITPGNSSTFIQSAAIRLAHIDKASIGTLSALAVDVGTLTSRVNGQGAGTTIIKDQIAIYDEGGTMRILDGRLW